MYYIINQTDQIIAIDNVLLALLNINDIDELTTKIILEKIDFTLHQDNTLDIQSGDSTYQFSTEIHTLSSVLGDFQLVSLIEDKHTEKLDESQENLFIEEQTEDKKDVSVEELILKNPESTENTFLNINDEEESDTQKDEKELFSLTLPNEPDTTLDEIVVQSNVHDKEGIEDIQKNEEELFSLTLPNEPDTTLDKVVVEPKDEIDFLEKEEELFTSYKEEKPVEDTSPILIDIDQISNTIGISHDDYKTFLDEYIDTAITLEEDLKSDDKEIKKAAIDTLTQLADVLQLPKVNDIISKINILPNEESSKTVISFYNLLSRLTVQTNPQETIEIIQDIDAADKNEDKNEILESTLQEKEDEIQGFGSLNLDDVKPIHFNFQLSQAANDLSLPEELIEEFVHDFIEQAREETTKMLHAYKKGDLDAIQKIGHLLKGASSNLRINELSDTLYAIQFCEDSTQLENLIKQYWGHFLSFEQQIDVISNKGNN